MAQQAGKDADQEVTVLVPYGWHGAHVCSGARGNQYVDWH